MIARARNIQHGCRYREDLDYPHMIAFPRQSIEVTQKVCDGYLGSTAHACPANKPLEQMTVLGRTLNLCPYCARKQRRSQLGSPSIPSIKSRIGGAA